MPLAMEEMTKLAQLRPSAQVQAQVDGSLLVQVAGIALPPGWSRTVTRVRWVLSPGYPAAQPDCFYAEADLRLAGGAMPVNSGPQDLQGEPLLWFSWHVQGWRPGRDDLLSYLRFIESRLADVR
jgi:hypothetical protein